MDSRRKYGCFITVAMAMTAWDVVISFAFIISAAVQEEVNMMDILDGFYRLFMAGAILALFVLLIDLDKHIDDVEDRMEETLGCMNTVMKDASCCAKALKKPEDRWKL